MPREVGESLNFGNTQNSTEIQNTGSTKTIQNTKGTPNPSGNPNAAKDEVTIKHPLGCSARSTQELPLGSSQLHCLA